MPTITRANDFGNAGGYYDNLPRANEIYEPYKTRNPEERDIRPKTNFKDKITEHDRLLIVEKYKALGVNQTVFAERAKVTQDAISTIMSSCSHRGISKDVFKIIVKYLGIYEQMECLKK